MKKIKTEYNNGYNGNSSHSVGTAHTRGRYAQVKKEKERKLKIEASSCKKETNCFNMTNGVLRKEYFKNGI